MPIALQQLERQKREILDELAPFSSAQLSQRPDPGTWSALQVLDHLVKIEEGMLRGAKEQLPRHIAVSFRERLQGRMMCALMETPVRVKVPPGAEAVLPDAGLDFGGIIARWDKTRDEWRAFLATFPSAHSAHGVFHHPVSGWMTLALTLKFASSHLAHHRYQLARIRRNI
jgi:hypothetical protein